MIEFPCNKFIDGEFLGDQEKGSMDCNFRLFHTRNIDMFFNTVSKENNNNKIILFANLNLQKGHLVWTI